MNNSENRSVSWETIAAIIAAVVVLFGCALWYHQVNNSLSDLKIRIDTHRNEIDTRLQEAEVKLAEMIEDRVNFAFFYVVVGSSSRKEDLHKQIERARRTAGGDLGKRFDEIRICSPTTGNPNYAIIIGPPVRENEARALQQSAVEFGFRDDAFISAAWRYDCFNTKNWVEVPNSTAQ